MEKQSFSSFATNIAHHFGASYVTANALEDSDHKIVNVALWNSDAKNVFENATNFDPSFGWIDNGKIITCFTLGLGDDPTDCKISFDEFGPWDKLDWSKVLIKL